MYSKNKGWRKAEDLTLTPLREPTAFETGPARLSGLLSKMEEEVGFEPTDVLPPLVFKTSAIGLSATLPNLLFF